MKSYKPYEEPKAKVIDISRRNDIVTIILEVSSIDPGPLAPSGLYVVGDPGKQVIEFHKLQAANGKVLTFETYNYNGKLPDIGSLYLHRLWWTPDQLEAVKDTSRIWTHEKYPDNGDHDHCLLTWETIAAYAEQNGGYRSGRDWITEAAYQTYIVDDKLRVRKKQTD